MPAPRENRNNSGFLPVERECLDQFVAHGYVDAFRLFHGGAGPLHLVELPVSALAPRNIGWRIDYFFVSDDLVDEVQDCTILSEGRGGLTTAPFRSNYADEAAPAAGRRIR